MIYVRLTRPWYDERRLKLAGYVILCVSSARSVHVEDNGDVLCPCCGVRFKLIPKITFRISNPKKCKDMVSSADEHTFVSSNFKSFCQLNGYDGLNFKAIRTKGYYYLDIDALPAVRLEYYVYPDSHLCSYCGAIDDIGVPTIIKKSSIVEREDFMVKTDINLDSRNYQHPCLIVGPKTKEKMEAYGLKNLYFEPVYFYDYGHE